LAPTVVLQSPHMRLLDKLQRRFGRFAVPHVTEVLIACQALTYVFCQGQPAFLAQIALVPRRVLEGEVWRVLTFVCQPPPTSFLLFALFFWYLFYLMGTALESTWGAFRYNVYLLVGWLATVSVSFLQPDAAASIGFLQGSVFLAFAYLYPDFQLLLFFILPVKMKWLALLQWIVYGYLMLVGDWMMRLMVLASVGNFFLFFWEEILSRMRAGHRRMARQAQGIHVANTPRHTCRVCGVTNLSDPKMSFRYCSKCEGAPCYCAAHIHSHEHVSEANGKATAV
jgi:hypothetical protein